MMIIGVDYHPSFQAVAFLTEESGECGEQELNQSEGQAEKFYRDLKQRGICVRVGMEATGYSRLEKLSSAPWASRRRQELLELLDRMNPTIEELTAAVVVNAEVKEEQGRSLLGGNGEVRSRNI
jgi:hypothetical protein